MEDENNQEHQQPQDELKDLEIVIDDSPADSDAGKKEGQADQDDQGDQEERRAKSGGEERDDDAGEDKDDPSLSPEQREKRKKRREERRLRKERRDAERREVEELRRELSELKAKQGSTEQYLKTGEYKRVEAAYNEAVAQAREAKRLLEEAKEKENWGAHAEALEAFMESRARAQHLGGVKQQIEQASEQRDEADPEVARLARDWRSKNDWYDPNGRDVDSRIAAAIDEHLASEGYDPRSREYWQELDKRLAKRLPHRVKNRQAAEDVDDDLEDNGSPTSGSGRERAPNSNGKRTYRISADRLAALKELGVDVKDPKAMAPYVKRFMEWDKQNADLLRRK